MKNQQISIIIINFNGYKYLKETLPPLLDLNSTLYEVIVVDNGSTDGSVEYLSELNGIKLIKSPRKGEKNFGCNEGVKTAAGEYLLMLDNDMLLCDKNILSQLLHEYNSLPECGCISLSFMDRGSELSKGYGCFTSYYYSWEKPALCIDKIRSMHRKHIGTPNGAGFFIKRELWNYLGGYDDHLAFGGDDDDIGIRLWHYGYKNYLFADSVQLHIGQEERSDTDKYSIKLKKKVYAHLYTTLKNFRVYNVILTCCGYIIFSSAKSIKQSIDRRSIKPFISTVNGYLLFLRNIPQALHKRKIIQKSRVIKKDTIFKIRPEIK